MVRATNSLPVPVSPVTSTVSVCPATRSTMPMNLCIIGLAIRNCVPSITRRASGAALAATAARAGALSTRFFPALSIENPRMPAGAALASRSSVNNKRTSTLWPDLVAQRSSPSNRPFSMTETIARLARNDGRSSP